MSEADKDGRMAEWVSDRMTILHMEMAESIREAAAELARVTQLPPWLDADDEHSCG